MIIAFVEFKFVDVKLVIIPDVIIPFVILEFVNNALFATTFDIVEFNKLPFVINTSVILPSVTNRLVTVIFVPL